MDAAGDARVQVKMDRFLDRVLAVGYEQAFYEGTAEALGYPANKKPFKASPWRCRFPACGRLCPRARPTRKEPGFWRRRCSEWRGCWTPPL